MSSKTQISFPRPPFDPELEVMLNEFSAIAPLTMTRESIPLVRQNPPFHITDEQYAEMGLTVRDIPITGHNGDQISVSVIKRIDHVAGGPGIYHTHGGGMVTGDRFAGLQAVLPWVLDNDAVLVTVEYRLAPEYPDPYPLEDCYAGLEWTASHANELGFDTERLMIVGASAGGGLAAGTALLARDRNGPKLIGQVLVYPMLDDRNQTISSIQYDGVGLWDRASNLMGWECLLGDRRGTDNVSIYAAPARATDLSNLPPTFIDCGSAEVFRDENVAYASALWAAGVQAELHVWPGGWHGFDLGAPNSFLAKAMLNTRREWVKRLLSK